MAIKNFLHVGLEKFYNTGSKAKINAAHAKKLGKILDHLDAAVVIKDMNFPGSGLHRLKGKLKDFYSIHISGNYVVIFRFENGNALDVDYLDYH